MTQDVELECRCGTVHGWLRGASPDAVNRLVCYCDDCQAFLHHIGRADLLDTHGGTDIVQVAPASVEIDAGMESIAGVRLRRIYRWYASCCKTPLGNFFSPAIPFIGIGLELLRHARKGERLDDVFGAPRALIQGKFAVGQPPPGSTNLNLGFVLRCLRLYLGWKLRGKAWPNPFVDRATGVPRFPLTTLTRAERDALRPLCGPHPDPSLARNSAGPL